MTSITENRSILAFATVAVVALGFGLPAVLVYLNVFHGLDIWFVGFFTLLSLAGAVTAPTILMDAIAEAQPKAIADREVELLRESQIELLKDLDDIADYLGDVRDQLRLEE